jgi:hypothetical protein
MKSGKRSLIMWLFVGVLSGLAFLAFAGTGTGQAEEIEPADRSASMPDQAAPTPIPATVVVTASATPVFECYGLLEGDDPGVVVRLTTDNFGGDLVRVRNLSYMCENALKYGPDANLTPPPDPALPPVIFACYRIQHGANPADPFVLSTENFGEDKVVVGNSIMMCEQGAKHIGNEAGVMPPNPRVWQCYALGDGDDPSEKKTLVTDNFGVDRVIVRKAVMMCESAKKERLLSTGLIEVTGIADGAVLECYRLTDGDAPNKPAVLETDNFGRDQVRIRQGTLMCEPGKKTPLFDLPPATGGDPRIDSLVLE